jgi:altronate hydrolase
MTGPFLHLHPDDNVLVARASAPAGTEVKLANITATLSHAIPLAHKIAYRDIVAGERILKYGMPIGIATEDIAAGAHVHIHNIRSAYTPTHALQDANGQSPEASK